MERISCIKMSMADFVNMCKKINEDALIDYDEVEGVITEGVNYTQIGEWLNEDVVGIHTDHYADVWIETSC